MLDSPPEVLHKGLQLPPRDVAASSLRADERMRLTRGDLPVKSYGEIRRYNAETAAAVIPESTFYATTNKNREHRSSSRLRNRPRGYLIDWCHEKKTQSVYREVYISCKLRCVHVHDNGTRRSISAIQQFAKNASVQKRVITLAL